jgi:hypothetical protein
VLDETSRTVVTFIVRIARDPSGRLRGIVERVRTGEKQRFTGAAAVGGVIEQMLGHDEDHGGAEAAHRRR